MSKTRRRLKAKQREAEYRKHGVAKKSICLHCGGEGPHFVPPSLGDPGFFICEPAR